MRIVSTAGSAVRHSLVAFAEALLIAAIIAALLLALSPVYKPADFLAGTEQAAAAKGGKAAAGSGGIAVPDGVFGQTTTASVSTGSPVVYNSCYQNGLLVLEQYARVDEAGTAVLGLGPTPMWLSGAANCVAEAGTWANNGRWRPAAKAIFAVAD